MKKGTYIHRGVSLSNALAVLSIDQVRGGSGMGWTCPVHIHADADAFPLLAQAEEKMKQARDVTLLEGRKRGRDMADTPEYVAALAQQAAAEREYGTAESGAALIDSWTVHAPYVKGEDPYVSLERELAKHPDLQAMKDA